MNDRRAPERGSAEVALAEAQAVLAMVQDDGRRDAARGAHRRRRTRARSSGDDAEALEELLELGPPDRPPAGPLRAGRRAGGAARSTASFRAARELAAERPGGHRGARARSRASALERVSLSAVGPGAFVALARGRRASSCPSALDRQGARIRRSSDLERADVRQALLHGLPRPRRDGTCLVVGGGRGRAREGARAGRVRRPRHRRRARRSRRSCERSASSWLRARVPSPATSTAASSSSRRRRTTTVNRRVFADAEARGPALQRRRRARALQLHPAGRPSPGADRGRGLHRRRLAGARAADPRTTDRRSRSGRSTPSSPSGCAALRPWAKRTLPHLRGAAGLLPRELVARALR